MMAVDVVSRPTFALGRPRMLFERGSEAPVEPSPVNRYDVTPDGRKFLMVQTNDETVVPLPTRMVLVVNWFEELKRLVPRN